MPDYPGFSLAIRVYYEDTDAGGVVYYANYLKFFERARTERLRALGFEQSELQKREGILFAVRTVVVDYLKPARFDDSLLVTADIEDLKRASLTFVQRIFRSDEPEQPLCLARVRVVCLSAEQFTPRPIPDELLKRIRNDA